jgi:hypothetical protein
MNRKELFRKYRDHLKANNPNEKVIKDRMDHYLQRTYHSKYPRIATLDYASREIERQATNMYRMQKEMETL